VQLTGIADDEELLSVAALASAAPPAASAETVAIMVRVFRGVVSIGLFLLWVDGFGGEDRRPGWENVRARLRMR
jgi:ABC-type nitrate/sulfonate/bicarbonate transport system substrate-binding protein